MRAVAAGVVGVVASVLAVGCRNDTGWTKRTNTDTFEQEGNNEVDILWVVDDSYSMAEEQAILADGFAAFSGELDTAVSFTDFHIGIITTSFELTDPNRAALLGDPPFLTSDDDYQRLFQERARAVGVEGSDKEKGLEAAAWAVSPQMTAPGGLNEGFIRPSAALLVVVVSDEEDCSDNGALEGQPPEACYTEGDELTPVSDLLQDLRDLKTDADRVTVSGIVGQVDSQCDDVWTGVRYIPAATQTGGHVGDICDSNWDTILQTVGLRAADIRDQFQLSRAAYPSTILVHVDTTEIDQSNVNGWTYDVSTRYIQFHGDSIPPRESIIIVEYTVDPSYVPSVY